jgi:phenylpyruvate tautomerase PptA (4-oxalocrotonate tautomerase family)
VVPLVRVSLIKGRTAEFRRRVGDAVHGALVETIGVPERDRFQLINEHDPNDLVYDREYLGIKRTDGIVVIQVTISTGRSAAQKRALFRRIADNLAELDIRREDVWINLVEVARENWSFGLGLASYAPEIVPAEKKRA